MTYEHKKTLWTDFKVVTSGPVLPLNQGDYTVKFTDLETSIFFIPSVSIFFKCCYLFQLATAIQLVLQEKLVTKQQDNALAKTVWLVSPVIDVPKDISRVGLILHLA